VQNERQLLELLLESSPAAIVAVDAGGRLSFANRRAEEVLGIPRDEITRRRYDAPAWRFADFDGRPLPGDELPFAIVLSSGREVRGQGLVIGLPDGRRRFLRISAAPLHDGQGRVDGTVATLEEVADPSGAAGGTRASESAERRVPRSQGAILADMSHELRTSLASILGFSELLQGVGGEPDLTEKQRRWVGNIQKAGNHLLALVGDVLDLSRIEVGKISLELMAVDLAEIGSGALERVRPEAERKGIELRADLSNELPAVMADPLRLKQVLWNLLMNGIRVAPAGGWVELAAWTAERDGHRHLEVAVRDSGAGIRPEDQEKVFEHFVRPKGSGEDPGTGLGLSLARQLLRLHGGRIWVESSGRGGEGNALRFTLPAAKERRRG
jgi:signal transduction histidine kinase